jgi:hypothetical protein
LLLPCSDDEEPPALATTAPSISPAATDEPAEPAVTVRTTRSAIKKVSHTQARNAKRAKKAKETDVSLEAHASAVSSDEVSDFFSLVSFSYSLSLKHFYSSLQALMKKFVALGTECAGYLKVAKASEGINLISNHCCFSGIYLSITV